MIQIGFQVEIQSATNIQSLQNGVLQSSPWLTFVKLWPTLQKCHFCTATAVEFLRFCDSGTWRKRNMNGSEGGESDLGEKKISGEIKVKSSLHDHSEMSAPQKMHI